MSGLSRDHMIALVLMVLGIVGVGLPLALFVQWSDWWALTPTVAGVASGAMFNVGVARWRAHA